MASYDSDSSSDGDELQTNVTLGYATEESTGDEISHIGGQPTWLDSNTTPSAALARCKACNGYMSLLLQLHADLQQHFPEDERRLFVWCCRKKQCSKKSGSVRAFREVKKAKFTTKPQAQPLPANSIVSQPKVDLGSQLFGGSSTPTTNTNRNPFSSDPSPPQSNGNPFSLSDLSSLAAKPPQKPAQSESPSPPTTTFADKLKISSPTAAITTTTANPSESWPPESSFPLPFRHSYLDAEAEYLDAANPPAAGPSNPNPLITNLDEDDTPSSARAEKDLYESSHDKTFSHFTKILSQNPEQILRYEFAGRPLLYSSTDAVAAHFVLPGHSHVRTSGPIKGIPRCGICGSARVFECQLVPHLIYELEKDDEEAMKIDGVGMEWGTIIVGTCSKNCGDEENRKVVFQEEWVGVQWEEEVRRKG
ncbi:hypothetical protein H2198_006619 [Neophaeococcomyces mojaviensis]|uniref:Uncharacterized protein n=1 Tax=Neophaeococcomyces mojaviensis TaxID=3383035 RepID=A0ACC3A2G8_9EURO|nr:hypothetical protein H2198_006619 [Knufia sp. JES_112]